MPNTKYQFSHRPRPPSGVERACGIAKSLFAAARGDHETDAATINTIARRARLTPATMRKFLQPSRRPKDVSLTVWARLVRAYRRYLDQQLAGLQNEIARVEALSPSDSSIRDLLDEAKALVARIEALSED